MTISVKEALQYLEQYQLHFRDEYERFTTPYPRGGGYPRIIRSPYLAASRIECYLGVDGAIVLDESSEPPYAWEIAGGPALIVDQQQSLKPAWLGEEQRKLAGDPNDLGLYRIVANQPIPDEIWTGALGKPIGTAETQSHGTHIIVRKYRHSHDELIKRLSFGAFQLILDLQLNRNKDVDFWKSPTIRGIGVATADREHKRFMQYCELVRHVESAAWDRRAAWIRAYVDVQREFAHAATAEANPGGGFITVREPAIPIARFQGQLDLLHATVRRFESLVREGEHTPESIYHQFLLDNPIVLDIYGQVESKPRWFYASGESPLGKAYVEPDFVIRYPNESYKLIEIERASHKMATQAGHPTAPVGHAAFQIAEWRDYIARHYDKMKTSYPNIAGNFSASVVISRSTEASFAGTTDINHYMAMMRQQYGLDEVITWDVLLDRARSMVRQLSGLGAAANG